MDFIDEKIEKYAYQHTSEEGELLKRLAHSGNRYLWRIQRLIDGGGFAGGGDSGDL